MPVKKRKGAKMERAIWEESDPYGHAPVQMVAQLFDQAVKRGQIESGKFYNFNQRTKSFTGVGAAEQIQLDKLRGKSSTGNRAVESAHRKPAEQRTRQRLTIAEARKKLRFIDFQLETDPRAELLNLRRRARGLRPLVY
jgi:hypothetical protein